MPRNITVDDSTGSEHISISDEEESSGVQVPSHSTGSHDDEYTDSAEEEEEDEEEEEWDYIEAEIEPSDSASRPRVQTKHRSIPPPAPRPAPIRRKSSHRVPVREAPPHHRSPSPSRHRREREPRQRRRRPESVHSDSLDEHDDYPGYARGPPPHHPHPTQQWAHVPHQPPASGYAPSVLSVPPYNPFTGGMPAPSNQLVPFSGADPYGYSQNPFSPPLGPGGNPFSPSSADRKSVV